MRLMEAFEGFFVLPSHNDSHMDNIFTAPTSTVLGLARPCLQQYRYYPVQSKEICSNLFASLIQNSEINETNVWCSEGILSPLDFEVLDAYRHIFLLPSCQKLCSASLRVATVYSTHHLIPNLQLSPLGIHIVKFVRMS